MRQAKRKQQQRQAAAQRMMIEQVRQKWLEKPVLFTIPQGIAIAVERQTRLSITGTDKQKVGQVAADIRSLRKPDVYKNKGIRYAGERLKKKAGKAGGK